MVRFWNKGTSLDQEKEINPGIKETVETIVSLFSKEQLDILDIVVNEEKFEFLQRMILFYGDMHPIYELEETKKKAQEVIDQHGNNLQEHIDQDIYEFIKKFSHLFECRKKQCKKEYVHPTK